jgi:multidrug efflux system membrane fusion protein
LQPDDRVVVNGLQRVRPGIEVAPKLVDMAAEAAAKPANGSAEKKAVSDTKKSEPEKKAEK